MNYGRGLQYWRCFPEFRRKCDFFGWRKKTTPIYLQISKFSKFDLVLEGLYRKED